jgi:hypothetical protein
MGLGSIETASVLDSNLNCYELCSKVIHFCRRRMEFSKCGVWTETVWRDTQRWKRAHGYMFFNVCVGCTVHFVLFIALWAGHSATVTCCYFYAMDRPHNVLGSW